MKYLFLSLRPKQWVKNLLIFLPLIFGKKLLVFPANGKAIAAFFLFSITAGVVYLINDLCDKEKDRVHPVKRLRPIASGKLNTRQAGIAVIVLGILSVVSSFALNVTFGWIVSFYILFNYLYSRVFKEIVIIDIFCIGGFFLLRVMAGNAVAEVDMSHWMFIMTVLLALFLGFNKRRRELEFLGKGELSHRRVLGEYSAYFIDQMITIITSSLVVVYMLYVVDGRTVREFGTKNLLYSVPFVYYGIFRYLYLIDTDKYDGDPTHILYSDRMMLVNIVLWIIVCIWVIYGGLR